jgi:hypothetical protein
MRSKAGFNLNAPLSDAPRDAQPFSIAVLDPAEP